MSELPDRPDLDQLRRQARELLRAATDGEPRALGRIHAVSDQVALASAQLALAREYGFPSWRALRTEAEHPRRISAPPAIPADRSAPGRAQAAADRWSFGGATAIETAAGTLSPRALVAGPGQAAMDVSLLPSPETQRRLRRPARARLPGMRSVATLFGWRSAHFQLPRFDDVVVRDDRGATYALAFDSGSIPREEPGEVPGPTEMRLRVDPIPPRECGWLELRGLDGSSTRLLPSARLAVEIAQLARASSRPSEREPAESQAPADGPQLHLDIGADLPTVDGTSIQLDCLVSEPDIWRVYLRARPGWWRYSADRHHKWDAMSVDAEDNLGGQYRSTVDGSTGYGDYEELALRFQPRIDPLADSLQLTFAGPSDQVAVDVRLAPTAQPRGE